MRKSQRELILKIARKAGVDDGWVHQEVVDSAVRYWESDCDYPEDMKDEDRDVLYEEVIEAFVQGVGSCYPQSKI